jgi:hypothetical protein
MAGRPRTRRAEWLAFTMALDLELGPARIEALLDRCGYRQRGLGWLPHQEQVVVRMAIARLIRVHGVHLRPDGFLELPPRSRRGRAA